MSKSELGEFLQTRRAAISPRAAGLADAGRRRRVPGLRREEVAALVGLSTDYYVRLEQGRAGRPSESVLEAISTTLKLDAVQRDHLYQLAHPARRRPRVESEPMSAPVRAHLDTLTVPALVLTAGAQVIGWNALACALFTDFANRPVRERNTAWLLFCDEEVAGRHRDWEGAARNTVGMLRMAAGRNPGDPELIALVDELTRHSPAFLRFWSEHHVYEKSAGVTQLRHPELGDIDLTFVGWTTLAAPNQILVTYTPEPGSSSARALDVLGSGPAGVNGGAPVPPFAGPGARPALDATRTSGDPGEVSSSELPHVPSIPSYVEVRRDPDALRRFNDAVIEQFRATGGTVGGPFSDSDVLVLTMTGAKSGRSRATPLEYFDVDGRLILIGTFGGAPRNPAWVHNLRANPAVLVEIGDRKCDATAEELPDEDAGRLFAEIAARNPRVAGYPVPERRIPLFELHTVDGSDHRPCL